MQKRQSKYSLVFHQEELEWCKPLAWVPRTRSWIAVLLVESAEGYLSLQHHWEKDFELTWMDVLKRLCGLRVN